VGCTLVAATAGATAQIIERLFPFLAPASPAVTTSFQIRRVPAPRLERAIRQFRPSADDRGAILAAAANFNICLEGCGLMRTPRRARETFEVHTRNLHARSAHHGPMDAQPEFTKAFGTTWTAGE